MTPLSTNVHNDDFALNMSTGSSSSSSQPLPPPIPLPTTTKTKVQRIPRFRPSIVSFGPVYDNMQQFEHFNREYHAMLLRQVPDLLAIEPNRVSRVGVIPSSIKRTPIITTPRQDTTTVTRKLEPIYFTKSSNYEIFSGPHYLPEKYSIKPLLQFRQKYFVPSYSTEEPSRYFMTPDVHHYFQAALQDGSYFESFTEYKPSDPINFRHAYHLDQSVNTLEPMINKKSPPIQSTSIPMQSTSLPIPPMIRKPIPSKKQPIVHSSTITTTQEQQQQQQQQKPTRKWHKPTIMLSEDETEEDSDDSIILVDKKKDKGKGRATDIQPTTKVSLSSQANHNRSISSSSSCSSSSSSSSSNSNSSNSSSTSSSTCSDHSSPVTLPTKRHNNEKSSSPLATVTKKRKLNSLVPTKKLAIEDLRQLGKFIKAWKQKDAEVCCVCYEDVTTASNPLVYCDNALCEVIVHKNCYKIKSQIGNQQNWYCDRCRPIDGVSIHRDVTCVVCPSITGAFCKLSTPFNGIEWVHMICAKALTGPGGFIYQPKTQDYKMTIRNHIPIQRFTSSCMYCSDPMFADFGAKIKCHYCPRSFHVTCAEKNGYWCFHTDAILACSQHAIYTTAKSSPQRLALVYDKWLSKRDAFYLVSYEKTPDKFKLDAWKQTLKHGVDVGDSIDETYQVFFDHVQNYKENETKRSYSHYVSHLLNEFCKSYTSTGLLKVNGLFLKKNFYHNEKYCYQPTTINTFYMCEEDEEKEEEEKEEESEEEEITNKKKQITTTTTTKKKKETAIVIPSDDLMCSICLQHELPQTTWDKFNFTEFYLNHLEETKHLRKVGHTGSGNTWDPRVFIECSVCQSKVHCGCPTPPIKKYPQKFQSFVCIHCDTKGEELLPLQHDDIRRRGTTGINYKV